MKNTNKSEPKVKPKRIVLIGCSNVQAADICSLAAGDFADDIVLAGTGNKRLLDEVAELQRFVAPPFSARIRTGDLTDAADADIAVIAEGVEADESEIEFDSIRHNGYIVHEVVDAIRSAGFNGIILMTTEPIDIMAQLAREYSDLPPNQVFGLATYDKGENAEDLPGTRQHVPVSAWCSAASGHPDLFDLCDPNCEHFDAAMTAGRHAAGREGNSRPTMATCVKRICEAILKDENVVVPVSVLVNGGPPNGGFYTSLPCVIGRDGIRQVLDLPMSEPHKRDAERSAKAHLETVRRIKQLEHRAK